MRKLIACTIIYPISSLLISSRNKLLTPFYNAQPALLTPYVLDKHDLIEQDGCVIELLACFSIVPIGKQLHRINKNLSTQNRVLI